MRIALMYQEVQFLKEKTESQNEIEIEIIAIIDDMVVGTASVGKKYKVKHCVEFGISVAQEYWGHRIGLALMEVCIERARNAGLFSLHLVLLKIRELYQCINVRDLMNMAGILKGLIHIRQIFGNSFI